MLDLCKEIVVFLLFAKMLEGFQTENKYGKFIKLLISLVVVLKLITPIFSLFDGDFDFSKMVTQIEHKLMQSEENEDAREDVAPVEKIEVAGIEVKVDAVRWEK